MNEVGDHIADEPLRARLGQRLWRQAPTDSNVTDEFRIVLDLALLFRGEAAYEVKVVQATQ